MFAKGSKITHFKKLHQKTGLPYSEMVDILAYQQSGSVPDLISNL